MALPIRSTHRLPLVIPDVSQNIPRPHDAPPSETHMRYAPAGQVVALQLFAGAAPGFMFE